MGGDAFPVPAFASKADMYMWLIKQAEAMVEGPNRIWTDEANLTIGLGNVAALFFYELNRFSNAEAELQSVPVNWFGFYLLRAPQTLALGPFQGRPACTEIHVGRGVCGTVVSTGQAQLVANVHDFPGHIACDSASVSEVVVPLRLASGSIVGVIDVDSTQLGHFDAEDQKGLESLAAVLVKHLRFPLPNSCPSRGAAVGPAITRPPTTISGISHISFDAVKPTVSKHSIGAWEFTTTQLDRIVDQEELSAIEKSLGISAFPEMYFPANRLTITLDKREDAPVVLFDAYSLMKDAAAFYHTELFRQSISPQMTIPVAESWLATAYPRHDPNVDWAWRNRYFGIPSAEKLRPLAAGMHGINWDTLRDNTIPILFCCSLDLFEDDLHDHGLLQCTVKLRVMQPGFFILLRHCVHIHKHVVWARDVRLFYEFDRKKDGPSQKPYIVVQEQLRKHVFSNGMEAVAWRGLSLDDACQRCAVVSTEEFYVEVDDACAV